MDKYSGKRLDGRYEIGDLLGVGGMAYVYKAYDSIDDRVVAIKILKDEFLGNEEFMRRFKNESKAIAVLSHPNIVKVYDVSFGDRIQYIVMEYIDGITLATLVVTAVIMVALSLFINKTRMGKAMRAVSEDKEAAELMGISVNRTITVTFAIGSALAGVAAIFYGAAYTYIRPTTGAMPGIKAFTAAVFGGIGSIPGALLGGVLLGIIEIFAKAYISTQLSDAIVFAVLIVVLIVRPAGLLGKQVREKV